MGVLVLAAPRLWRAVWSPPTPPVLRVRPLLSLATPAASPQGGNYLKGVFFTGENAAPNQFNYGTLYGSQQLLQLSAPTAQYGTGGWTTVDRPVPCRQLLHLCQLPDPSRCEGFDQLNLSRLTTRLAGGCNVSGTNRVIYADNPYLPDSVAQDFVCNTGNAAANNLPGTAACSTVLSNGYNPTPTSIRRPGPRVPP